MLCLVVLCQVIHLATAIPAKPVVVAKESPEYDEEAAYESMTVANLGPQYRVYDTSVLLAPCGKVWDLVRDRRAFVDVSSPGLKAEWIDVEGGGISRIGAHLKYDLPDGASITEEIVAIDETNHMMTYRTVGPAFGLYNCLVRVTLHEITDDPSQCFIEIVRKFTLEQEQPSVAKEYHKRATQEMVDLKTYFATGQMSSKGITLRDQEKEI